ncbi:MAG: tetratricopeptide repeat protein [Nitrospiria bacterium]
MPVMVAMIWGTAPPGWSQTGTPPDPLQEAIGFMQQGRLPEAIERLSGLVEERPADPAVWLALGQAYEASRRPREAIEAYRRAVELAAQSDAGRQAGIRLDQLGPDAETYEEAQRSFQEGAQAFRVRDLPTAEGHFTAVLERIPRHLPTLLLLGTVLEIAGRNDEARARWEAAVAVDPAFFPAQVNLGRLAEREGRIDDAITAYRAAVATGAAAGDVTFAARRLAQLGGDADQAAVIRQFMQEANEALRTSRDAAALQAFERVRVLSPTHAAANFGAALFAAKRGDTGEAVRLLKRGLEGDPDFYPALFLLAEIEAGQGQFELAIEHFSRVAQLVGPRREGIEARRRLPGLEEALSKRKVLEVGFLLDARRAFDEGIELFQRKDYEAAFKAFGKAVVFDEQNPYYIFNRGLAAFNMGNNLLAAKSFEKAVELLPSYGLAHFWLGLLFQSSAQQARDAANLPEAQAEYTAALQKFDLAVRHGANDWFLEEAQKRRAEAADFLARQQEGLGHLTVGGVLGSQGRLKEALQEFSRSVDRFPYDYQPLLNIGAIYTDLKVYDLAKAMLERAAVINPRSPKPYIQLGFLYESQTLRDEAIVAYREASKLAPDAPEPLTSIGTLLMQQEKSLEAIKEFERAIELSGGTGTPLTHWNLAFLYGQNGQPTAALKQYRQARDLLAGRTEKEAVDLRKSSEDNVATLEKRLKPYRLTLRATPWSYDSNMASAQTNPVSEVSTSVSGSLVYWLVNEEAFKLRGSADHNEGFSLLRRQSASTSTALGTSFDYTVHPLVSASGSYRFTYAHGSSGPQSLGQSLGVSVSKRGQLPSGITLGLSYGTSSGLGGSFVRNSNRGYSLSLSQTLKEQGSLSVNYSASANDSNRVDQVNQSQNVSVAYSRTLWKAISASWSYDLGLVDYVNPTTESTIVGGRTQTSLVYRKNLSKTYGMDFSYGFREDLTMSLGVNLTRNEANVSLDRTEDVDELLANLVRAGGNFRKLTMSFAVSKTF